MITNWEKYNGENSTDTEALERAFPFAVSERDGSISLFKTNRAANMYANQFALKRPCNRMATADLRNDRRRCYAYNDAVQMDAESGFYSRMRLGYRDAAAEEAAKNDRSKRLD